ncbi:sensor histidine kinase [Micromonospora echinaurantiaca]|uniref:sensor histidine kinase n=1 Tax=Micromonospora echinaurantiaca TaxID=47857 RepID=UPI00342198FA
MAQPDNPVRVALYDLRRLLVGPDVPPRPATTRRRWHGWRSYLVPFAVLALVGLTAAAAQYLEENRGLADGYTVALGLGATVPVALAVRWPLWAWRLAYPLLFLGVARAGPDEPWPWNPVQILGYLVVLVVLGTRVETGVVLWAGAATLLPVYLFVAERANAHGVTVLVIGALLLADQIRRRRLSQRALAEQAERSELEQARRAVLEERTRIARELHDVVAHHMSMIAVRAETAPYRLDAVPEPARAEFTAIAGAAREALTDMRRLLGVLRSESADPQTAPQPGLPDVPALVEAARRAGMTVTLEVDVPAEPPAPVGLAAYRIVQEALANAARHAAGAEVRATIRGAAGALQVRVANDRGDGLTTAGGGRAGHGLTGMRERAVSLGGTFTAGPTDDGGYAVVAVLPCDGEDGTG